MRLRENALHDYLYDAGFDPEWMEEGTELTICCTLCQDDRPRLYVNADGGHFVCFHCGEQGSFHRFLVAVLQLSADEGREVFRSMRVKGEAEIFDYFELREDRAPAKQKVEQEGVELPPQMQFINENSPPLFTKYLRRRHVSLDLAQARGIGYCLSGRYRHRIIIPVRTDGHLYSFVARTVLKTCPRCDNTLDTCVCLDRDGHPRKFPKVLNPLKSEGAHPKDTLFNLDFVRDSDTRTVVVTEGVFDALRMPNRGLSILGSSASPAQVALLAQLARHREVVVCLDGDEAGFKGARKLAHALVSELVRCRVVLLPEGADPGSMSRHELEEILASAKRFIL